MTRARAPQRLAILLGALGLVRCSAYPTPDADPAAATTREALHAVTNDASTAIARIVEANNSAAYFLLVANHRGYALDCGGDFVAEHRLARAAGFSELELSSLTEQQLTDPAVQALFGGGGIATRAQLALLPCKLEQDRLFEFDRTSGSGVERHLLVDLGDKDETNTPILHDVGCGQLLANMGLDISHPTVLALTTKQLARFARVDDAYDIHCHTGSEPIGYVPRLAPAAQTVSVNRAQWVSAELAVIDPAPAGKLVELTNDCGHTDIVNGAPVFESFLTIHGMTVSGVVDARFPRSTCSATYDVEGPAVQTTRATITLSLGCDIGTNTSCSACGETCAGGAHTVGQCRNYACSSKCEAGYFDCDGDLASGAAGDGCESRLDRPTNCGGCGNDCAPRPNAVAACHESSAGASDWACGFDPKTDCLPGFTDDDGDPTNGCEASHPITSAGALVINELDYDNPGFDTAEFIELYNPTSAPIALAGYTLYLVNGSGNAVYRTIDLGGVGALDAGQYLVIGSTRALAGVPAGQKVLDLGPLQDLVQNGAPDGVALVNTATNVLVDAISYEGIMTAMNLPMGQVGPFEATSLGDFGMGSIGRAPNGANTGNGVVDWAVAAVSTPGAPN
jgi:hypothetical protein